jgi:Polyprenyl synthetase
LQSITESLSRFSAKGLANHFYRENNYQELYFKTMSAKNCNGLSKMQMTAVTELPDPSTWSIEKEKIILGPFDYLLEHPGKNVRTRLLLAFNKWLQVPVARMETIIKVVEMLHTASLLSVQTTP